MNIISIDADNDDYASDDDDGYAGLMSDQSTDDSSIYQTNERVLGLFLMRAADELDLTHNGIERLCHSFMEVMGAERVKSLLPSPELYIDIETAYHEGLEELDNLSKRQYRENFYQEEFNYVVCE